MDNAIKINKVKRFYKIMNIFMKQRETILIRGDNIRDDDNYEWYFIINRQDYEKIRLEMSMYDTWYSNYNGVEKYAGVNLLVVEQDIEPKLVSHDKRLYDTKRDRFKKEGI
jgi:hypothetical protein